MRRLSKIQIQTLQTTEGNHRNSLHFLIDVSVILRCCWSPDINSFHPSTSFVDIPSYLFKCQRLLEVSLLTAADANMGSWQHPDFFWSVYSVFRTGYHKRKKSFHLNWCQNHNRWLHSVVAMKNSPIIVNHATPRRSCLVSVSHPGEG